MKKIFAVLLLSAVFLIPALSKKESNPFAGRWDITITPQANPDNPPKNPAQLQPYPDWMEVTEHDGTLAARMVGRSGSVHPVSDVKLDGGKLMVTVSAAARGPAMSWELQVSGSAMTGVQKR